MPHYLQNGFYVEVVNAKVRDFEKDLVTLKHELSNCHQRLTPLFVIPLVLALFVIFLSGGYLMSSGSFFIFYLPFVVLCIAIERYSVKRKFMSRKGLICPNCGYFPKLNQAFESYQLHACINCNTDLDINKWKFWFEPNRMLKKPHNAHNNRMQSDAAEPRRWCGRYVA